MQNETKTNDLQSANENDDLETRTAICGSSNGICESENANDEMQIKSVFWDLRIARQNDAISSETLNESETDGSQIANAICDSSSVIWKDENENANETSGSQTVNANGVNVNESVNVICASENANDEMQTATGSWDSENAMQSDETLNASDANENVTGISGISNAI